MVDFYPPWDDHSGMWTPEIRAMQRRMLENAAKRNKEEWDRKAAIPDLVRKALPLPWVRR
jgi:hypothetical protein